MPLPQSTTGSRTAGVDLMRRLGLEPDPWQLDVLQSRHPRLLLNCCRQAGKSTVVATLALAEAVFTCDTKVLLFSRSHRQARELFKILKSFYERLHAPIKSRLTADELQLKNGSRVISLPCREDTIRGYSQISLIIIDEAARVPDDLYRAARPMLAVSGGRMICLSTPFGKRGFFHDCWSQGGDDWIRIEVPAARIPRIPPEFLEQEKRALGISWYRQEYECSFEALEGLTYPHFQCCLVDRLPPHIRAEVSKPNGKEAEPTGRRRLVGGIDFGFRDPFVAIWGTLDREGVLYLTGEHYVRQRPLSYHAARLPRAVVWYCDPSGASERRELQIAGFTIRQAKNALRPGIAAVSARIENGTLRILEGRCPHLLAEAALYRYGDGHSETPLDEHNHALDALRYLIFSVDAHYLARPRPLSVRDDPAQPAPWPAARRFAEEHDESMWITDRY